MQNPFHQNPAIQSLQNPRPSHDISFPFFPPSIKNRKKFSIFPQIPKNPNPKKRMQDADPSKSPLAQNSKLRQTLIPTPKRASQSPNPNAQMEEEDAHKKLLQTLIPKLSSSTSKLSAKSRTIPYDKDFHFFNNFPEFKLNSKEIALTTESSLNSLNSLGLKIQAPLSNDPDEAYDWLVNLNDDLVEKLNSSLDEFKSRRVEEEDGFQVVVGRKKKKEEGVKVGEVKERMEVGARAKVPFHIPSIKRPQDEYSILVNNANKPFEHVWLERSQDGERFVHPLEKLSISDFIDRNIQKDEIVKPLPIEITPFKLVEEVQELKELAAKLRDINEFAVDLEHNHYRSFQGLTCLMQISTRKEDFVIDTFKLRVHIGPYLREVFRDPSKRKVMHGADRDIEWLQRDFGIYVCNLFDTGQASRVMQLERNSLEYLLHHFCEVVANKEYQNADWRVRPLPDEMLMYAREDTHYLLYIYDLMRSRLLSSSSHDEDLLLEVYKRSYDVCIHLYERELSTDTSFLHIYGLKEAEFNSKQLAVADGLYRWRDRIARDEDESTGFILPNRTLLEIAKQIPVSHGKLKSLAKSKHSYVARDLNNVIMLIKRAIEKSSDYESIVEQLKARLEELAMEKDEIGSNSQQVPDSKELMDTTKDVMDDHAQLEDNENSSVHVTLDSPQQIEKVQPMSDIRFSSEMSDTVGTVEEKMMDNKCNNLPLSSSKTSSIASVQIMKKQSGAFGALLGHPTRKKTYPSIGYTTEQDKNVNKVEQIKSSVTLPFHSFSGEYDLRPSEVIKEAHPETRPQRSPHPAFPSKLEEVIKLENSECDATQSSAESTDDLEIDSKEEPTSLSDISTSFQQCFRSINQSKGSPKNNKRPSPEEPEISVQVKPFDYANARINFSFGGNKGVNEKTDSDSGEGRRSANRRAKGEERVRGLRRQAFPPSGNRSTTYK